MSAPGGRKERHLDVASAIANRTVLVTGGAGFIGSNLVRLLGETYPRYRIRVLDNLTSGLRSNLEGCAVEFTHGDILDKDLLFNVAQDCDTVVHLAAIGSVPRSIEHPSLTHDANVNGTLNVLEAARSRSVSQVVFASSSSVYGANPARNKREKSWTRPLSPYAASKLAAESYVLAYANSYGIGSFVGRFFNVYGPGQRADHDYAALIPRLVSAGLSGEPMIIFGDGKQSRDFTYVGSLCRVLVEVIARGSTNEGPVNLAFGTRRSVIEVANLVSAKLGIPFSPSFQPARVGEPRMSKADPSTMLEMFPGLRAVSLEEGVERTVEWFKNGNLLQRARSAGEFSSD